MTKKIKNTVVIWVWTSLHDWPAKKNQFLNHFIWKWYIAVKHLHPCFLTTFVKSKYLEILLGKSGESKSKCTLKAMWSFKKNGACNLKKEVSTHRLGLVINLGSRVAPPWLKMVKIVGKRVKQMIENGQTQLKMFENC